MISVCWSVMFVSLVAAAAENPVYEELTGRGIVMSDGSAYKLPTPILPDGLDAAGQGAALKQAADARNPLDKILEKSFYAPVMTKVRTVRQAEGEGPAVRSIDVWFVAHGDWNILTSKDFLESLTSLGEGKSNVVSRSGFLTDEELKHRGLKAVVREGYEERFPYATFSLFERVEISATRRAVITQGKESVLAAGRVDARFDGDAEYPNQWRPLLRDARAEIQRGPARPFSRAGGYAKITKLAGSAGAVFLEAHLLYEEPFGWFDGANLVKQKAPAMAQERVRTFRRKLALAEEERSGSRP